MGKCQSKSGDDHNATTGSVPVSEKEKLQKPEKAMTGSTLTSHREKLINLHGHVPSLHDMAEDFSLEGKDVSAEFSTHCRFRNIFSAPVAITRDFKAPNIPKTAEETAFLKTCIRDNFIFSGLNSNEFSMLMNAMSTISMEKGKDIIKQGTVGDFFYFLREGKVSYIVDGAVVGHDTKGASFGELALLYHAPRAATVRADTYCDCFCVDQKTFRTILVNNNAKDSKKAVQILKKIPFLTKLEDYELNRVANSLTTITFRDGEMITKKGDFGKVFYIVKSGKVLVTDIGSDDINSDDIDKIKHEDKTLKRGDYFGELSLITGNKRSATIYAIGDCVLWCLSRKDFNTKLGNLEDICAKSRARQKLIGVPIIANAKLERFEIEGLASALQVMHFKKGHILAKQGEKVGSARALYLIISGQVTLTKNGGAVSALKQNDYWGELNLVAKKGDINYVTAKVIEETTCHVLSRKSIVSIIGDMKCFGKLKRQPLKHFDRSVVMDALMKHTILGAGMFGQVWLVSNKKNGEHYALKIQNKREVIKHGQVNGVVREKKIMSKLDHPFLNKLVNSFHDDYNLYLVLGLVQGGELFSMLRKVKSCGLPESSAKFYSACILEALSYMHYRNILFRDLKPENVLIDEHGYCVLVDFGFAKVVLDKTYTLCGTPLYIAPEIILCKGYDKGVDYWALGVLMFEMLMGCSPFYRHKIDQVTLFKRIVDGSFSFPSWCKASDAPKDIISQLLVVNQTDRLGVLANGAEDIRQHIWLSSYNQEDLLNRKYEAPWLPQIKDPLDVSNFENWSHLSDKQKTCGELLSEEKQLLFDNF